MNDVLLLARAWNFAAERHAHQRRKGEAQEPYVNHLAEVAELVATATRGKDANLVAAAVLHDAVEDTETPLNEVRELFGDDVAALVAEVTDDKTLPKHQRKAQQIKNAPKKSGRAKILKLSDKTSNIRSIAKSPPADSSAERKPEYLGWAQAVANGLRGENDWIEARFEEAVAELGRVLEADATNAK